MIMKIFLAHHTDSYYLSILTSLFFNMSQFFSSNKMA